MPPTKRAKAASAPPPTTSSPVAHYLTFAVTRPMTGCTVVPGQQIIFAGPGGQQFRTTIPPGVQPGQTFQVKIAVSKAADEPEADSTMAREETAADERAGTRKAGQGKPMMIEARRADDEDGPWVVYKSQAAAAWAFDLPPSGKRHARQYLCGCGRTRPRSPRRGIGPAPIGPGG